MKLALPQTDYQKTSIAMDEVLRWIAAIFTIVPGIVIATRPRSLFVGWAFVGLTVGALLWILIGYLTGNYAILAQNVAISIINTLGIYRWLIWQGKAGISGSSTSAPMP